MVALKVSERLERFNLVLWGSKDVVVVISGRTDGLPQQ